MAYERYLFGEESADLVKRIRRLRNRVCMRGLSPCALTLTDSQARTLAKVYLLAMTEEEFFREINTCRTLFLGMRVSIGKFLGVFGER